MKVNLNKKVLQLNNEPIMEKNEVGKEVEVSMSAMLAKILANFSSKNPHRAYMLARAISDTKKGDIDLKAEDIVFIKEHMQTEAVSSSFASLLLGQIVEALENAK